MRLPSRPVQALVILILWLAVTTLTGRAVAQGQTIASVVTEGIARQLLLASAFLVAVALVLRWPDLGFRRPASGTLRLLWLPGLYLLLYAAALVITGPPPPGLALILLVNTLLVGVSEELMFRGVLYSGLRERLSVWPAVAITTILFGTIHVLNVFVTGHIQAAAVQSLAACLSGLLFLALRLRMGSIWPVIGLHAAWNFALVALGRDAEPLPVDMDIPLVAQAGSILFVLPLGLYGLWLLRHVARDGDGLGPANTGLAPEPSPSRV